MATTRTAVFMFLASTFFCAPVLAQGQNDLQQMAASMATMAAAMERLAQAPAPQAPAAVPAPAPTATVVPSGGCDPANCPTREEFEQLKKRVVGIDGRLAIVEKTLKGRIAPRPSTAPAPAPPQSQPKPTTAPAVSMTAPAAERLLAIKFVGSEPNSADLAKVRDLVGGGRYDLADVVVLPTTGTTPRERAYLSQARVKILREDMNNLSLSVRDPADSEESAQLVAGAPAGTGVVFHLRLKGAKVATAPATP